MPAVPPLAAALLILVAGFAGYANSGTGVFVLDDEPAIAQNGNLEHLWPPAVAMSAPRDTTLAGRPVAALSFAVDHAVSGGSLRGYHTTNLLIHLAAALLVFGITRRTLRSPRLYETLGDAATPLGLVVALLFVVHPLQTASVTYLVQRVESLMGLFYLATLDCAIRALDTTAPRRLRWTIGSVIACALGMATKEVMVTAPLIVALWDWTFAWDRTVRRAPLYGALAATWAILAVLVAGGARASAVGFGFPGWPWWRYLMTQTEVVAHYFRLALVPTPLVLDYEWPPVASVRSIALPAIVMGGLVAATAWGLTRRAPAAFAGAWCFLILAPTSSVIPIVTEVAAEHRMYLPTAGVMALAVVGLFALGRRTMPAGLAGRRRLAQVGAIAAAAVVIGFARLTYERNLDYQSYDRIWADTIAKRPRNARARNNYATSLLMQGRYAEAEPHLRIAVEARPDFAEAQANLGVALSARGRLDEGERYLQRAVELRPDFADAHRNLGETYALQHRPADAAAQDRSGALIPARRRPAAQPRGLGAGDDPRRQHPRWRPRAGARRTGCRAQPPAGRRCARLAGRSAGRERRVRGRGQHRP